MIPENIEQVVALKLLWNSVNFKCLSAIKITIMNDLLSFIMATVRFIEKQFLVRFPTPVRATRATIANFGSTRIYENPHSISLPG